MSEDGRPDTRAAIRDAWSAALETDRFGDDESFFDLGGHSLLGAKAMAALSRAYGQRFTLRLLFRNPTVRQLAAAIDAQVTSGVAAPVTGAGALAAGPAGPDLAAAEPAVPADWTGTAVRPVDVDTAFNGFVAANVIYALDRLGLLAALSGVDSAPLAGLPRPAGADERMLAELLRAAAGLGYLRLAGDRVGLTGAGRDALAMRGYFTWGVGGYSAVFAAAADLVAGRAGFGGEVCRDEEMVALGSGQNDASFMAGQLDRTLAGLDFGRVADLGSGGCGRLLRVLGDRPGATGLGLDISGPATAVAAGRIAAAGMADRVRAVRADALDVCLGRAERARLAGVDLVMSFFLLHDLLAPEGSRADLLPRLREAFPAARTFVLADTMLRPGAERAGTAPVFSVGFELAHALMGVPLHTRQAYEELFAAAGLAVRDRQPFGTPHSWLYVLAAD